MTGIDRVRHGAAAGFARDLLVTILLWGYYTAGFVVLFLPFYLLAGLLETDREKVFQRLNCSFYQGFFFLVRRLIPACRWRIDPEAARIRGAVIVCNHVSYLDPILLISLFPRHRTLVKNRLFAIPLFGRMLALSGYLPAAAEGRFSALTIDGINSMPGFLAEGGNLFVFPEGTRSRSGQTGRFNPGAFKVAKHSGAPIVALCIRNTDRLYAPGKFCFDSRQPNTVCVEIVDRIPAEDPRRGLPLADLIKKIRSRYL